MNIKAELRSYDIEPDVLKDQFFLTDENIIRQIVNLAEPDRSDVVLEIGAGVGNLTRELAKRAGKVIALEIDEGFRPFLEDLPRNVDLYFEDAHKYAAQGGKFRKKREYNKIVSNLPYSFAEWFLHNIAFIEYEKAILLVAKKFSQSIMTNDVFSSFFRVEEKIEVPKEKFYPVPRTDSVVIDLIRLPDPIKTKDLGLFLRQFIYQREGWKTKNSIREGLITYARLVFDKTISKNEAREIITKSGLSISLLDRTPGNPGIYDELTEKMNNSLFEL